MFVPIGVLLGPHGLGIVTPLLIGRLEPVLAVALATLGVFVGMALDVRTRLRRRLLLAASIESVITMTVLGGALIFLYPLGLAGGHGCRAHRVHARRRGRGVGRWRDR